MYNSGSPRADAEADFLKARRQQVLGSIAGRFRSGDEELFGFDEVVRALGHRGERRLGTLVIPLERVVGTVDKTRDFDRAFRPTSGRSRRRWERIAEAVRRGETIPPIDVYRLGDLYFVRDGHHRVSVFKALGLDLIEADVTEVQTAISPAGVTHRGDLDRRHWRRIFFERVPLEGAVREQVDVADPHNYHRLAEMVEAWSARRMHSLERYLTKADAARCWWEEEYTPVRQLIEEAGLGRSGELPLDTYLRVACERYELTRAHVWDAEVMEQLSQQGRRR